MGVPTAEAAGDALFFFFALPVGFFPFLGFAIVAVLSSITQHSRKAAALMATCLLLLDSLPV